jgi:hypothetical protein
VASQGLGPFGVERVEGQRFLGGPPAVDGGLADPGSSGDRFHADRRQAAGQQEFRGCVEDGLVRLLAARPATPRGLRGLFPAAWQSLGAAFAAARPPGPPDLCGHAALTLPSALVVMVIMLNSLP